MGLFSKKADPISSKARALDEQMAALEIEIKELNARLSKPPAPVPEPEPSGPAQPAMRSTATPRGNRSSTAAREPIFESVERSAPSGPEQDPSHFNDLGVRKYDIAAEWRRLKRVLRGPSAHNAKLVSYLAAGSIRGLQPLRYEKRVARNRFVALTIVFLIILCALIGMFRP